MNLAPQAGFEPATLRLTEPCPRRRRCRWREFLAGFLTVTPRGLRSASSLTPTPCLIVSHLMLQGPVRTDGSYTYGDRATGITNDHCNCLRSPFSLNFMWRYNLQNGMSIKVSYKDGVFQPLENVE